MSKAKHNKRPDAAPEDDAGAVADGMAVMRLPAGGTSCSFEGQTYDGDEEGLVVVPQEAVVPLLGHGLKVEAD